MFCEKCGKMNDDGAIFCSNCSSVLRSRRQTAPQADGGTKRFKITEEMAGEGSATDVAKPVVNEMPSVPVTVREKVAGGVETEFDEEPVRRQRRSKPSYSREDYNEEYETDGKKEGAAWCAVLSVTTWVMFIAMLFIGIGGGSYLIMNGLNTRDMQILTYAGGAGMIFFIVIALMTLSKNMVKIKTIKLLNEIKNKNL